MPWPFTSPLAPTLDTGFTPVPTSPASLSSTQQYLVGGNFTNTTSDNITVTLTDTSGAEIAKSIDVPPGSPVQLEWAFMPTDGLKWSASSAGVIGKIWGY